MGAWKSFHHSEVVSPGTWLPRVAEDEWEEEAKIVDQWMQNRVLAEDSR